MNDAGLLVRSTGKLYLKALRASFQQLKRNYWLPVAHFAGALLAAVPLLFIARLLGIVGSFAAGLALTFLVAVYLASMRSALQRDAFASLLHSAQTLFFPVLHVLFFFFIIELLFGFVAPGEQGRWIRGSVALLIGVFGNAIPEQVYLRGLAGTDIFSESFEFIVENWVEWFLPAVPVLLLLAILLGGGVLPLTLALMQVHPFDLVELAIMSAGSAAFSPSVWPWLLLFSYGLFFVALFRAALFEELAYSSRRKRIYAERTGL